MSITLRGTRTGLRELAEASIRDAIVRMELEPGSSITEEMLASELEVSRPVLREAIQRLESERLIDRLENGRMRVSALSVAEAQHLYGVRAALEELTVREAAARLDAAGFAHLETLLSRIEAAKAADQVRAVTERGAEFHAALAEAAGNPVRDNLMRQISGPIERFRYVGVAVESRPEGIVDEHRRILELLRDGAVDEAAQAMRAHVLQGLEAVVDALDRR